MRISFLLAAAAMAVPLAAQAQSGADEARRMQYRNYINRLNGPLVPKQTPLRHRLHENLEDRAKHPQVRSKPKPGETNDLDVFDLDTENNTKSIQEQIDAIDQANRKREAVERAQKEQEERIEKERVKAEQKERFTKQRTHALFSALYAGDITTVRKMFDLGADPNEVYDGYTPLHYAADLRKPELIVFLLQNPRVRIGTKENRYFGLFHWAAYENRLDIVKLLLQRGADPTVRDDRNLMPIGYAESQKHTKMVEYLRTHTPK